MSSRVCTHCGCSDIDIDPARGNAVCTSCGSVLEDHIIVSEVQFAENSLGGTSVIGQYVSAEGGKTHNMGSGFHHGFGKESRAITLQNGKRKIQHLGGQLRLNQHCIDTAYNFFKMAVNKRLTRGRKTTHVVAACLYLVCRTEGTPHMLLDFSDLLQVNVYSLGRTYLQLSRELCINVPALDPCLYIHRFAHKLEFGEKTHEVSMTALRLVSRMKRDWLSTGRRPSGLCGAALLVAARIHDFSRTMKQVIRVVKIGESTVRKRLSELEATPSGQLTIDEFQKIDLEDEADPPSFTEGKLRTKLAQLEEQNQLCDLTNEISNVQSEIERALEDSSKRRKGKDFDSSSTCSSAPSLGDLEEELAQSSKFVTKDIQDSVTDDAELISSANDVCDINNIVGETLIGDNISDSDKSPVPFTPGGVTVSREDTDPAVAKLEQEELDSLLMPPPWNGGTTEDVIQKEPPIGPRPTAASLGLKESIEECMKVTEEQEVEEEDGELDLTDICDDELEKFILNDEEVRIKTKIWMKANCDYLKEQEVKAEREARDKELGLNKPEAKKKRKYKKKQPIQANSAGEAIEKMLQERKISSKINYEVLKDLNKVNETKAVIPVTKIETPILGTGSILEATPVNIKKDPSVLQKRFKRSSISLDSRPQDSEQPPGKRPKGELADGADVVIESGPVDYVAEDEAEDEDAGDYYEDELEHMSAAQLMGHTGVDEDYHEGYDIDDIE